MLNDELNNALDQNIDSLYLDLGRELYSNERYAMPLPVKRYIERATSWMSDNKQRFKDILCSNEMVINYLNDKRQRNRAMIASAILDLIASITTGVSPVTVTALIVNEGIEALCLKE